MASRVSERQLQPPASEEDPHEPARPVRGAVASALPPTITQADGVTSWPGDHEAVRAAARPWFMFFAMLLLGPFFVPPVRIVCAAFDMGTFSSDLVLVGSVVGLATAVALRGRQLQTREPSRQGYLIDEAGLRVGHMPVKAAETFLISRRRIARIQLTILSLSKQVHSLALEGEEPSWRPSRQFHGLALRVALVDRDGTAATLPLAFGSLAEAQFVVDDLCWRLDLPEPDSVLLAPAELVPPNWPINLGPVEPLGSMALSRLQADPELEDLRSHGASTPARSPPWAPVDAT
jgi:hypothetical protein